jgi:DNA-binding transcriptional ArsR family regulator
VLRELTDESVLDVVFVHSAVTRAEIARQTGISKATINEAVRRLERAGLLVAGGSEEGRPGRAGTFYELASDAGFIIAAELGAAGLNIAATDLFGQSIASLTYPPPDNVRGVEAGLRRGVKEAMARGARALAKSCHFRTRPIPRASSPRPRSSPGCSARRS